MNYIKIKHIAEEKNITFKSLCGEVGVTEAGLHQMIRNKSIKVDILEKISIVLKVPISHFFEDEKKIFGDNNTVNIGSSVSESNNSNNNNNNTNYSEKTELLEAMGKIIKSLERNNNFYAELTSSLFSDISDLYIDLIEKHSDTKGLLKNHKTTKGILSRINTFKVISGEQLNLNDKFLEYIESIN